MLVHNKGKYVRHRGHVRLLPGANNISEKDWKFFISHKMNKKLADKGEIVAHKAKKEKELESSGEGAGLKDLSAAEAIELVKDTFDKNLLNQFKEEETRTTVIAEIENKLHEMSSPPKEGA